MNRFTPTVEVALCGHATLAAAHVLFEYNYLNSPSTPPDERIDTICFNTLYRGQLRAQQVINESGKFIELDFPSQPPSEHNFTEKETASLCRGLSITPSELLFSGRSIDDVFLVVPPEVFARIPTLASGGLNISDIGSVDARGVIVTCVGPNSSSNSPFANQFSKADFLSRFFAPQYDFLYIILYHFRSGISEDPVTGSAHTALAPYWCEKLGKTMFVL